MGACASKPKEFDKKRIPPVAPTTPRKPDPQEDEKASETMQEEPAVEPSDSEAPKAEEVAAAAADGGGVVPEKEAIALPAEEAAVEKPAGAINEKTVAEEKTISEVVINNTKTTISTEEEIKTEV